MYTYLQPFVGIPLNQHDFVPKLKSTKLIKELEELAHNDLSINRYVENEELYQEDVSPSVLVLLNNLKKLINNEVGYEKFQTFITDYKLDFKVGYNGGDENPIIFGFYVEELCPLPDVSVMKINVNMSEITRLSILFEEFAEKIFTEHDFNQLKEDNVIGAFFNIHSS